MKRYKGRETSQLNTENRQSEKYKGKIKRKGKDKKDRERRKKDKKTHKKYLGKFIDELLYRYIILIHTKGRKQRE